MDGDARSKATDVWAAATADAPLLPALRPSTELVRRTPPDASAAAQTLLGLVDALVSVVEQALGGPGDPLRGAGDTALGLAWQGYQTSARVAGALVSVAAPVTRLVVDPPLVPTQLTLRGLAAGAAEAWRAERPAAQQHAGQARDVVVPMAIDAALVPVDLTRLVLARVDLEPIVRAALEQIDLTQVVLEQVDLERVVTAALDQVDLTAIARDRVDLVTLAREVIDAIDLPEIIRASTGSVASETVRSIRMQSIGADQGVQRLVDRAIIWRRNRDTEAPAGRDHASPSTPEQMEPDNSAAADAAPEEATVDSGQGQPS